MTASICLLAFATWAVKTRTAFLFEKDQYFKQILDNSPYTTPNMGLDGKYMKACQVTESGALKGVSSRHVETAAGLFGDTTETWSGPCYVEIAYEGGRKVIWGKKLVKVENQILHSVHVTID